MLIDLPRCCVNPRLIQPEFSINPLHPSPLFIITRINLLRPKINPPIVKKQTNKQTDSKKVVSEQPWPEKE